MPSASVLQRLEKLESENRRWKIGFMSILIAVTSLALMGQFPGQPKIIEAQGIVIKSRDGTTRVVLGMQMPDHNAPMHDMDFYELDDMKSWGLHLYGAEGRYRAGLVTSPERGGGGGHLLLKDKDTPSRIDLLVGRNYVDLHLSARSESYEVYEQDQAKQAKAFNSAKSVEERERAWSISKPASYSARLHLFGDSSALTLAQDGKTRIALGNVGLQLPNDVTESRPLSSIVLFDKAGSVVWQAPR